MLGIARDHYVRRGWRPSPGAWGKLGIHHLAFWVRGMGYKSAVLFEDVVTPCGVHLICMWDRRGLSGIAATRHVCRCCEVGLNGMEAAASGEYRKDTAASVIMFPTSV